MIHAGCATVENLPGPEFFAVVIKPVQPYFEAVGRKKLPHFRRHRVSFGHEIEGGPEIHIIFQPK
jgi:hypothetical protein